MGTTSEQPDVVGFVKQQHQDIKGLFAQVTAAGPADRAEVFQCLVRLLAVHETAEEEVVHPAVRRFQGGEDIVRARLEEEAAAKRLLADLEKMGVDDPAFDDQLQAFQAAVLRHAASEEAEELPLLRQVRDDDLLRMTTEVKAAEAIAPTHPHPHGPESATGNLLVGPFVAVADRVRDLIRSHRA